MLNWLIYFVDRSMANVLDRGKILQHMEIALELKEERKNEKLRLRRDTNKVRGL